MPVGVIINILCVVLGGIAGSVLGDKLTDEFKDGLNTVFGVCSMTIGISSVILMVNMPAVIFSVIAGTTIGLAVRLGEKINRVGEGMMHIMEKILRQNGKDQDEDKKNLLVTTIVLFCCSGTGIYGCIVSGMTGDHSILLAKSILDLPTALIFACSLGMVVSIVAVPQLVLFLILFFCSGLILPLTNEVMIADFKACGGILMLVTGFRMIKVKNFPVADMIPAMILVMPFSWIWSTYILPLVS